MAAGKGYSEFRTGWPVVLAAMLGICFGLSPVPFYSMGMLAPALAKAFGWSFAEILGGFPIMTFAVLFASPVVGWLSDRYGVRRIALTSLVLFALCFMSFALSDGNLTRFYVTWGVMAVLGAGSLPVTWTRAVNNRFEVRKGLALGLTLLGTGLFGFFVKPFLAYVLAHWGWRGGYVSLGALSLILAFPVALFAFHDVGGRQTVAERRQMAAERAAATPGLTFGETLRDWRFWVIGVAFLPISFAVGGPIPNMENILKLQGFTPGEVVSLAQLIGLSVIVGRIGGGWLIDRVWAPGAAFVLLSLPAAACWGFTHHLSYAIAATCIGVLGFAAGVEYDLMAFLVARYFGMKSYGAIYGTLYGFFAVGAGFGPVVFGRVFDQTHSYASALIMAAAMFLGGALLLLFLGRYRDFGAPSAVEVLARAETVMDARPD
jgi:MFS family permease